MRDITETIAKLPSPDSPVLPAPPYRPIDSPYDNSVVMFNKSMENHTTDESWQLMKSLQHCNYLTAGHELEISNVHTPTILKSTNPSVVVMQDKREWEGLTAERRGVNPETFVDVKVMKDREDIFKLTILKDAQHRADYHRHSAEEIGCHAWITHYHPRIVKHVAPYVRKEHLIRAWHTIEPSLVPAYTANNREGCIISGARGPAYPLRTILIKHTNIIPNLHYLKHPGYRSTKCFTPEYLQNLSRYKVAICTSSKFGYALRKIIEATACGCRVITDLPVDESMPWIDGNLIRVNPEDGLAQVRKILPDLISSYSPRTQEAFATRAKSFYDWRESGVRLVGAIERLRTNYTDA